MPAKKPATKAPVKAAKKSAPPPAAKKPAAKAPVKKAVAAPAKKVSAKAPAPKPSPVKKSPSKTAAPKAAKTPAKPVKPAAKKAAPAAKKAAAPVKKAAPAKSAPAKTPEKKAPAVKAAAAVKTPAPKAAPAAKAPAAEKKAAVKKGKDIKIPVIRRETGNLDEGITLDGPPKKPVMPAAFLKKQRLRLVELRDAYMSSAEGVTSESLRNHESGDSSAFGMHQADAGSDAYDRDFALSLLAKEQDAIYEINEALNRIDRGTYGICEMSGNTIPEERLEALPFTRFTVDCQARIEREQRGGRWTRPVRSLFGLDDAADESDDSDEDDAVTPSKSKSGDGNESLDFGKE